MKLTLRSHRKEILHIGGKDLVIRAPFQWRPSMEKYYRTRHFWWGYWELKWRLE